MPFCLKAFNDLGVEVNDLGLALPRDRLPRRGLRGAGRLSRCRQASEVRRTVLSQRLLEAAEARGVDIVWGEAVRCERTRFGLVRRERLRKRSARAAMSSGPMDCAVPRGRLSVSARLSAAAVVASACAGTTSAPRGATRSRCTGPTARRRTSRRSATARSVSLFSGPKPSAAPLSALRGSAVLLSLAG